MYDPDTDPRTVLDAPRLDRDGTWWSNCQVCGYACSLPRCKTVWLDDIESTCPCPPWQGELAHQPEDLRTIALIGCGKTKLDVAAPARELYTGPLFKAAREYVEGTGFYDAWYILSAKHGLVHPDTVLEPYDVTMPSRRAERERWSANVDRGIGQLTRDWTASGGFVQLDAFAGDAYTAYLRGRMHFVGRERHMLTEPLQGLQVGERLHWFAERRAVTA